MSTPANPVTLPLAQYSPKHFLLAVKDGVADGDPEPARAEKPPDLRELP